MSFHDPNTYEKKEEKMMSEDSTAVIILEDSEVMFGKTSNNKMWKWTFEVVQEGEFKGKKMTQYCVFEDTDGKPKHRGLNDFQDLCRAVKQATALQEPEDVALCMLNKPFLGLIGVEAANGNFPAKNKVKKFSPLVQQQQQQAPVQQQQAPAEQPPAEQPPAQANANGGASDFSAMGGGFGQ